jgi:hypothetical protein
MQTEAGPIEEEYDSINRDLVKFDESQEALKRNQDGITKKLTVARKTFQQEEVCDAGIGTPG